jgi:hypothetical protein
VLWPRVLGLQRAALAASVAVQCDVPSAAGPVAGMNSLRQRKRWRPSCERLRQDGSKINLDNYHRQSILAMSFMHTSPDDVHVAMDDFSGASAAPQSIPFDKHPAWVQKDQWPSFDNWEYTVVFHENLQGEKLGLCQQFLGLVEKTGLIGELFKSPVNEKQVVLKLRASQSWYDERATRLNYLYELKPIVCEVPPEAQKIVEKQLGGQKIKPIIKRMYEPFNADEKANFMFEGYHNMYTSFRGAMIEYFLRERKGDGGCELANYIRKEVVANNFPNHEPDRVKWFQSNWMLSMPWKDAPTDEIRNYFGEKIAFYFAWLSHFTNWLIAPGIVGLCIAFFLVSRKVEEVNRSIVGPIFGALLMVYMTCYLEFWKRRSSALAFRWGVTDFAKKEPDRPEYEANETGFNFFTQQTVMFYPEKERLKKQLVSVPAVLFTIAAACTIIVIILMWKYVQFWLGPEQQKDPFGAWKLVVPSLCNTVAILIFSKAHRFLATLLNDWENYQTQSEYESQLIRKVFFFEFVNNFTGTQPLSLHVALCLLSHVRRSFVHSVRIGRYVPAVLRHPHPDGGHAVCRQPHCHHPASGRDVFEQAQAEQEREAGLV